MSVCPLTAIFYCLCRTHLFNIETHGACCNFASPKSSLFLGLLLLLSEFCCSGGLKRAGALGFVGLHDLRLKSGTGAQIAVRQIHDAGCLGLLHLRLRVGSLVVALVIALLKSH